MKRGAWHQCGDKSQKLVEEQLQQGAGVGVVVSPRDLAQHLAVDYAAKYHALGAEVLIDQQFYTPEFTNTQLDTYPISKFRAGVSKLNKISDPDLTSLADCLRITHSELKADGLIAPAVVYEAGRADIVQLNARLFQAAKQVGGELKIPTYATVVLGRSVTAADTTIAPALSYATALKADGWYFGFEFEDERIPSSLASVLRCCTAGLTLACTGKPVLHAYAGPMGLLSFGFGVTGVGIGHSQNLWKFTRDRWEPPVTQGGGGNAPPRYFSPALWGTIVYPDEVAQLPPALRNQVLSASPFCQPVVSNPPLQWGRWEAGKHLVYALAIAFDQMAKTPNVIANAQKAIAVLKEATTLHGKIANTGLMLTDTTNVYQANWGIAMATLLNDHSNDFAYLSLL